MFKTAPEQFYNFTYLIIFGYTGSLLLGGLFSNCSEQGLLSGCDMWASRCGGFSCCRAQAFAHAGFNSFGSWALEHRLNSRGAQA